MIRLLTAAALVVVAGLGPGGCTSPGAGPGADASSGPYDQEANPYCGVYGNCASNASGGYRRYRSTSSGW